MLYLYLLRHLKKEIEEFHSIVDTYNISTQLLNEQLEKLNTIISSGNQFSIISNEIKASILLKNGEINQSIEIYKDILTAKNINQRTQERVKNILKSFGEN